MNQPSSGNFAHLWVAYCEKKQECEDLKERVAELERMTRTVPDGYVVVPGSVAELGWKKTQENTAGAYRNS